MQRFLSTQPWLAPIVGVRAWGRIASLTEAIPPGWCWAGVEVRLGEGEEGVDLAVGWLAGERRRLARALASDASFAAPDQLQGSIGSWEEGLGPVEGVCLEYDDCSRSDPVVFWALDPRTGAQPVDEPLLEAMHVRDPDLRRTLLAACAELGPAQGRALHIASLEPRGLPLARLVAMVPGERLVGLLGRLGWPGDIKAFERELLARVVLFGRWAQIHLTCGREGLRGDGAVELYAPSSRHALPLWESALEDLEESGLCTSARRHHLLAWLYDARVGEDGRTLDRRLYLKLGLAEGGGMPSAKAYLGVSSLGYFAVQQAGSPERVGSG